ncbi:endonuclease/Exonuclease/ phosphatase [Diplogelasinospora grovesii]|uniref:Endonuclease/Exonuclease/ phosphatase n=1 Tax=Diplogelasinospora grovesii TaxID=303347 RepID=A0AAN6MZS6_9PEZI|nr:endonuclease/Exonuclease/ phosphatase [Diplogelasinospora grovesii]
MTAILLFAKDPAAVQGIEEAECGFGAAGMGNKGAVGLRVTWANTAGVDDSSDSGELGKPTELTFVATHLAAMEWNLQKRNSNWRTIVSGLTFANPKALLPGVFPANQSAAPPDMSGNGDKHAPAAANSADSSELEEEIDDVEEAMAADTHPLLETQQQQPLHPNHPDLAPEDCATLQDVSIFKATSHLFVAGDLNYRISSSTPPPLAPFPSFDPESENYYPVFLPRDQLTQERLAGRAFHGMSEAPIRFGPTYKYNVLCGGADVDKATNADAVRRGDQVNGVTEVPWKFAPHRWPGWCDRVLYLDLPSWLSGRASITVLAYDAMPVVRTSDHRAVFLRALVPVVGPEAMRPPPLQVAEADAAAKMDPRVTPPIPVDVHAWERRAAARNREIIVGWSAFLWSTREGAVVLATLVALGVGSWWLWSVW